MRGRAERAPLPQTPPPRGGLGETDIVDNPGQGPGRGHTPHTSASERRLVGPQRPDAGAHAGDMLKNLWDYEKMSHLSYIVPAFFRIFVS